MLKKHRKKCALIKEHRKKSKAWPPASKIKARGESQSKEYLEKHKNVPHTCTSRSSCTTKFFLDPVFGSTTSCGTNESLLSYPKLHIQAIEVGSWGSLKAFGEVNTTWAIEGTIRGTLSFFAKFSKKNSEIGSRKEEEWVRLSKNSFYFSTSEGKVESYKPHG
jgi:hypothetical protein